MGKLIEPIVGGNWNNGSHAGVFARNLNNSSANSNWNVGGSDSFVTAQTSILKKVQNRDRLSSVSESCKVGNFSSANDHLPRFLKKGAA